MGRISPGMAMMVMDSMRRRESYPRSEYSGGDGRRMIGYDRPENAYREGNRGAYNGYEPEARRRRDSRGRFMEGEGWQGNGYGYEHDDMRMGGYGGYGDGYSGSYGGGYPEARRRRDSRGRYMMGGMNGMDDDADYDPRRMMDDPPHMRGGSHYGFGDVYAYVDAPNAMNRPMGGMEMMNHDMSQPVDEQTARMWVGKMDGGEHFSPDQVEPLRTTLCPDCSKWEWYTAMNAMYSDHCETAKKLGMDKPEFYAYMAKDFIKDKDAKPHKLRRYMETIPK